MKKKDLIEELKKEIEVTKKVSNCEEHVKPYEKGKRVGLEFGWMFAEKLDEPELPVIPQFVADWYEKNKRDLTFGIYMVMKGIIKKHDSECSKIEDWFNHSIHNPVETVVLMKSGYTIEKEPAWTVKLDNGRYVDNFVEFAVGVQIDITSKLDCTAPIRFKDKSKAEAVALLVNGEVVEATDNV